MAGRAGSEDGMSNTLPDSVSRFQTRRCCFPSCYRFLSYTPDGRLDPDHVDEWYKVMRGLMNWACPKHRRQYELHDEAQQSYDEAYARALETEQAAFQAAFDKRYAATHPQPDPPPIANSGSLRSLKAGE